MLLATWEAAYRAVGWKPWIFPAPSHVLDSTLSMLNVRTGFGEPVGPNWPWPRGAAPARGQQPWYRGELVEALGVSCVRLVIGFALSLSTAATVRRTGSTFFEATMNPQGVPKQETKL